MKTRKRFYHFAYFNPRKGPRLLKPHQLRDADAFSELAPVLYRRGYEYGGIILNYPGKENAPLRRVDTTFLGPNDLIVLTTRPPLHDYIARYRKKIDRSFGTLEKKLFDKLEPHVKTSTRLFMELSPELAAALPREYANRACIEFMESGATYKALRLHRAMKPQFARHPKRTACYLLSLPKTGKRDVNLLCMFGMGGTETLVWSYLLRTKFHKKIFLHRPHFLMAELHPKKLPRRPNDLSFADTWKIDFIASIPL